MTNIRKLMHEKWKKIINMIPSTWFKRAEGSSIWVTAYRVYRVEKGNFISGPKVILDFDLVRVIITYDELVYADLSRIYLEVVDDNRLQINRSEAGIKMTAKGIYLLLFTPFVVDGIMPNETQVKERIRNSVTMLAAFVGKNIVYKEVFSTLVEMSTASISAFSPVFENPLELSKPDIGKSRAKTILKAYKTINRLPKLKKNRIYLSLQWFESALYDSGVDSFLKYWVALETLSMPDTTNILPVNEIIARAYGLPMDKVRQRFGVGRVQNLRSRIVHNGQVVPIHGLLLEYIEKLYIDILIEILGLPCEFGAGSVIDKSEFSLDKFLYES